MVLFFKNETGCNMPLINIVAIISYSLLGIFIITLIATALIERNHSKFETREEEQLIKVTVKPLVKKINKRKFKKYKLTKTKSPPTERHSDH
jgi:hypothetical protein